MRDEGYMLQCRARIEAIVAEVKGAELDNKLHLDLDIKLNYPPEWFMDQAKELRSIVDEITKYG